MSEDESFVILGSSPMSSMEVDGSDHSKASSPDFASLKNSQIKDLENACKPNNATVMASSDTSTELPITSAAAAAATAAAATSSSDKTLMQHSSESLLWSRPTQPPEPATQFNNDQLPLSLEQCAFQSPLTQSPNTSMKSKPLEAATNSFNNKENVQPSSNGLMQNMLASTSSNKSQGSLESQHLASTFIMGDVNADVLKTSVYSQFPSITNEASAEDVAKLQTIYSEYLQLKMTLHKVTNTMQMFHASATEWKAQMQRMEDFYKKQLDEYKTQLEKLHSENDSLKKSVEQQIEQTKAVDLARQTDRDDMIKTISEKSALVENMRVQIAKLEQQQVASFEFLPKNIKDKTGNMKNFDDFYITRGEHEKIVKDLNRNLSEVVASNFDLKDMEQRYIDELNCLKKMQADNRVKIAKLTESDAAKQKQISGLERACTELSLTNEEFRERVVMLEQQNELHRRDYEKERESRDALAADKQKMMQDLRALQKRNQQLIEQAQKMTEHHLAASVNDNASPLQSAAAAASSYTNNPQRPIRVGQQLPQASSVPSPSAQLPFRCPVCDKGFKALSVLQMHVNDCIDKV